MRYLKLIAVMLFAVLLCACSKGDKERTEYPIGELGTQIAENSSEINTKILLDASLAEINGEGATLENGVLTISKGGSYALSGSFNGTVVVEVTKEEQVELVLDGVSIYSENSAAIYVKSADKVVINLADESENILYDGETYAVESGAEPSACIYSADDLTICGSGTLKVNANCRNGIQTKNDLRIKGGELIVSAPKNALKGKDSVQISGGVITVTAATDAIKSDNEKEEDRGKVVIGGGELNLSCQDDGIQAFRSVQISGCSIEIDAGDKDINCDGKVEIEEGCILNEE